MRGRDCAVIDLDSGKPDRIKLATIQAVVIMSENVLGPWIDWNDDVWDFNCRIEDAMFRSFGLL